MADTDTTGKLIKPLSQPLFWALAIFLIAFWWITVRSGRDATPAPVIDLPKSWDIVYLQWLKPYMTSYYRKVTALGLYLGIMGLQLLEGWWILQLGWRVSRGLWEQFPDGDVFYTIRVCFAMGIWGIFVVITLCAGFLVLGTQLTCIIDVLWIPYQKTEGVRSLEKEAAK